MSIASLFMGKTPTIPPRERKEGVSWTYQNYEGYAPMFAYVGIYGYMLANELRPGRQHCKKGTAELVRRCLEWFKPLKRSNPPWRFDAGNDEAAMALEINAAKQFLLIKLNLRKECLEQWPALGRRGRRARKRTSTSE